MKNMKIFMEMLLSAIILFMFLPGCKKTDITEPGLKSILPTQIISGEVRLPPSSSISVQNLNIVAAPGEASVSSSGSFRIEAPTSFYSFIYALDNDDNLIAASYANVTDGIQINDSSTAIAIVMMIPIDWGSYQLTPKLLIQEVKQSSNFPQLLFYVKNLMINDPINIMNFESHPTVLKEAITIVKSIVNSHPSNYKKIASTTSTGAYIEDIPNSSKIKIINPCATPFGISTYKQNEDPQNQSSYFLSRLPFYVNGWAFNWWIWPTRGETEYELGDGKYVLMLSRIDPLDISLPARFLTGTIKNAFDQVWSQFRGDYLGVIKANARLKGILGGIICISARTLGIVSAFDLTEATGFLEIALDYGPEALEILSDITLAGERPPDTAKESIIGWIGKILKNKENSKVISKFAEKYGVKLSAKAIQKAAENFTIVLDFISAAEDAFILGYFMSDMISADQDIIYNITKLNGNASINVSLPPYKPTINGLSKGKSGKEHKITVASTDPEKDNIKYFVDFGDGTLGDSPYIASGISYDFKHSFSPGDYKVYAYAVDGKGSSSALSNPLQINITPPGESGFFDSFENYSVGEFKSNSTWNVDFKLPSQVRISPNGYNSLRSAKFIDYDPDIGDQSGNYAQLNTTLSGNPTSIEFSMRIDYINDAFGVRAWNSFGDWNTIAYYVLFDGGYLKWGKKNGDLTDPYSFVPIQKISVEKWYRIKLNIDWANSTYDIYVDNNLVYSEASFWCKSQYYYISSAPTFQLVAFTKTDCRAAYFDEISMNGATIMTRNLDKTDNIKCSCEVSK
jgi:hypothetical protein